MIFTGIGIIATVAGCSAVNPQLAESGSASGSTPSSSSIAWQNCDQLVESEKALNDLIGAPSQLEAFADRMQCATVAVPLDYDDPDGRQVEVAIAALQPTGESKGYIFTNPGGPGLEGRTMPAAIASSDAKALTDNFTLIGVDVRGTGGSTSMDCPSLAELDGPNDSTTNPTEAQTVAKEYWKLTADANKACVEVDQALAQSLTTANAARDLDRIREALGVDTIGFFGASWGTELGIAYQSMFPQSVSGMVLDSVMDIRHQTTETLDDVLEATLTFTAENEDGAIDSEENIEDSPLDMPESADPALEDQPASDDQPIDTSNLLMPFNIAARTAYTCNSYEGADDEQQQIDDMTRRGNQYGDAGLARPIHPVSGVAAGVTACAGWPFAPVAVPAENHDVPLLIIGHSNETVTPIAWAERAHETIGGDYLVLDDASHGAAMMGESAQKIVDFFDAHAVNEK